MRLQPGTHRLGAGPATIEVKVHREGVASQVGHDLVIEVINWEATVEVGDGPGELRDIHLLADTISLHVREGHGGVKPLSDRDRLEIRRNIKDRVLRPGSISFRSTGIETAAEDGNITVHGELGMAGHVRPISVPLELEPDGRVTATIPLRQSDWGIEPYSGMKGALKVRDTVEVTVEARLPVV